MAGYSVFRLYAMIANGRLSVVTLTRCDRGLNVTFSPYPPQVLFVTTLGKPDRLHPTPEKLDFPVP